MKTNFKRSCRHYILGVSIVLIFAILLSACTEKYKHIREVHDDLILIKS